MGTHPQRQTRYFRQRPIYLDFLDWKGKKAPHLIITKRNFKLPKPWNLNIIKSNELWTETIPKTKDTAEEISNNLFRTAVERNAPDHTLVFTDGSYKKETDRAGVGVYIPKNALQISGRIPDGTTNNDAELVAISIAIQEISDMKRGKYLICTDSKHAIDQISTYHQNLDRQKLIIQEILHLGDRLQHRGWEIMISWIPGHANIRGNEIADMLAGREEKKT